MAVEDIEQLELALLNKKKADLQAQINPLLVQVNNLIPNFPNKDNYVTRFQTVLADLFADSELDRKLLDDTIPGLLTAICMLDPADLASLGLDGLCP